MCSYTKLQLNFFTMFWHYKQLGCLAVIIQLWQEFKVKRPIVIPWSILTFSSSKAGCLFTSSHIVHWIRLRFRRLAQLYSFQTCVLQVFRDVGIKREILDLKVRCLSHIMGCRWTGELREAEVFVFRFWCFSLSHKSLL